MCGLARERRNWGLKLQSRYDIIRAATLLNKVSEIETETSVLVRNFNNLIVLVKLARFITGTLFGGVAPSNVYRSDEAGVFYAIETGFRGVGRTQKALITTIERSYDYDF